jgi:signal transduction histidine kinase
MVAPLQSIASHCSNIVQGIVPEERRQMRLEEVIGHARILCELAQRMRFLHELVSGKSIGSETLEFKNITTTWIDCFNNYLSISRFTRESVKIDKYKMNALPDIIGSRLPAQQIVMNLYDNASKYGLDGNVVIRAWRDGDYVVNEFAHDAAVRLTQDAIEQMFSTRGYRSPEARQIRASGTGIGMWISKQLMLAMGGDILASPTGPDGMTRFKLYWRISQ